MAFFLLKWRLMNFPLRRTEPRHTSLGGSTYKRSIRGGTRGDGEARLDPIASLHQQKGQGARGEEAKVRRKRPSRMDSDERTCWARSGSSKVRQAWLSRLGDPEGGEAEVGPGTCPHARGIPISARSSMKVASTRLQGP